MRPVHYHASGVWALYFDCYLHALRASLAAGEPRPRRHTDLCKVTCAACWRAIRRMADKRVGMVDAVARQHLPTRSAR
jgi:hypothetical protein